MNRQTLAPNNEDQLQKLWQMQDCLLVLQSSHDTITVLIKRIESSSSETSPDYIGILLEEALLMNNEIERLRVMINQQR